MFTQKKTILCWAGWYRDTLNDYKAIFIKKHFEILAEIANIHCFHIKHVPKIYWYKKYTLHEKFGNVTIYHIPSFFPLKHLGYILIPYIEATKAKRKFKEINIFHLYISYPYAAFTYLLNTLKIKKWILTEQWSGYTFSDNSFSSLNFLLKFILKNRLKKFDKISTVSQYLKNQIMQIFNLSDEKIVITYNTVLYPSQFKAKTDIKDKFKLLSISNLVDHPKNILFLLKVIKDVSFSIPNIQLDIYGEGKDKEQLIAEAKRLDILNKNVFFKGSVNNEEISEIYQQYHAFILLSKFETFSVVTAEAIAHGLPVVVSKCGAPEEYVNEKNGYLVPVSDLNATKQAILHLFSNYSKFNPLQVQSTILNKFSKETVKKQFEELLT